MPSTVAAFGSPAVGNKFVECRRPKRVHAKMKNSVVNTNGAVSTGIFHVSKRLSKAAMMTVVQMAASTT